MFLRGGFSVSLGVGAGFVNRRLLPFLALLLVFCLSFPADARLFKVRSVRDVPESEEGVREFSGPPPAPAPPTSPYFSGIIGSDNTSGDKRGDSGASFLLSSFEIVNPDPAEFYLLLSFDNGGVLRHREMRVGRGISMRLENLVLLIGPNNPRLERKLADEIYKSDGRYYEIPFLASAGQVQGVYRVELWGTLQQDDFKVARSGIFSEILRLSLVVNY